MMLLRRIVARMPVSWQHVLRHVNHRRQIRRGTFETWEPEFHILHEFVSPGDWVIDVGANVGYYTKKFSDLVGPHGRVIAVEPVPETFSFLASVITSYSIHYTKLYDGRIIRCSKRCRMTCRLSVIM